MDRIIEILQTVHPEVDYETETNLIDKRIFDSFDVVIYSSSPLSLIKTRYKQGKLTFCYSERRYKETCLSYCI